MGDAEWTRGKCDIEIFRSNVYGGIIQTEIRFKGLGLG